MSFDVVRPRIVSIIERATPTFRRGGLPARFKYAASASKLRLPEPRNFVLRVAGGSLRNVVSSGEAPYATMNLESVMRYPAYDELEDLDIAIAEDHRLMCRKLGSSAEWPVDDAGVVDDVGIIAIGQGLVDDDFPFTVEERERDVLVSTLFPVLFADM